MARDPKMEELIVSVMAAVGQTELSDKNVVRALLSVAAAQAVRGGSFEDCGEFEEMAHDFFHNATEVLEPLLRDKARVTH